MKSIGIFLLFCLTAVSGKKVTLSVMSYNTRQLPTIPAKLPFDRLQRYKHLAETIHWMPKQPDVLVFQELFYNPAEDYLIKMLRDEWKDYKYATANVGNCCQLNDCPGKWDSIKGASVSSCKLTLSKGGVIVLSKFPIVAKNAYVFSSYKTNSGDRHANKGLVHVKVRKDNELFNVLGTHLQADEASPDLEAQKARFNQIGEMWVWVRDHLKIPKTEPVILAGDLNVILNSEEEKKTLGPRDDFQGFDFHFDDSANDGSIDRVQSFDARSNFVAKADANWWQYDYDWHGTLDYVMNLKQFKNPTGTPYMRVIPLKAEIPWYWIVLDADQVVRSNAPEWYNHIKGLKPHGFYRDMSDHYPVRVDYVFVY